jgi:hypothetical protein
MLALAMKMSRKASPSDWASMRQFIMEDECDGLGGLESSTPSNERTGEAPLGADVVLLVVVHAVDHTLPTHM